MNTTSNFSSVNGWCMPGSGTWVSQETGEYYIDENGDLWVPCFCDGEEGGEGEEGLGRAAETAEADGDAFDCGNENGKSEASAQ